MPTISQPKKDKISEQILYYLFTISPDSAFTSLIAKEIARDEEFTKSVLLDLNKKALVTMTTKSKSGKDYSKRIRWRLSARAFDIYSKAQPGQNQKSQVQNNNLFNPEDND